jgi:hypothetical protein
MPDDASHMSCLYVSLTVPCPLPLLLQELAEDKQLASDLWAASAAAVGWNETS